MRFRVQVSRLRVCTLLPYLPAGLDPPPSRQSPHTAKLGSGFMVEDLGFMVYDSWFTVNVLSFKVFGVWLMVYGLWFMVDGLWSMIFGFWFQVSSLGFRRKNEGTSVIPAGVGVVAGGGTADRSMDRW